MSNVPELKELIVEQQLKIRQLESDIKTSKAIARAVCNKLIHMQQWHKDNPEFPTAAMVTICESERALREIVE